MREIVILYYEYISEDLKYFKHGMYVKTFLRGENVNMINENNFIETLKKKNIKALEYVVDNYSNLIFKVAYSVLQSRELSEECVNDVLMKVWNGVSGFNKDKGKFVTWIIILTKYTAIDHKRKELKYSDTINIEDEILVANDAVLSEILKKEERISLLNEIKKMDKENKEIFIRRFFLFESIRNISEKMKLSDSAVSNRILREKKKMSKIFNEEVIA